MRLYVAAALLWGQAMWLIAEASPWAAVGASALGLVALLVKVAVEVGEHSAALVEAKDAAEASETMERRLVALEAAVETQKRQQALSKLVG
jgi:hypothetical protein